MAAVAAAIQSSAVLAEQAASLVPAAAAVQAEPIQAAMAVQADPASSGSGRSKKAATMRKAIIEDATGTVVNVILLEPTAKWSPRAGHSVVDADDIAEPGAHWDGAVFTRQPLPPPDLDAIRLRVLGQQMLTGTAGLRDIQEYLVLQHGIVASSP